MFLAKATSLSTEVVEDVPIFRTALFEVADNTSIVHGHPMMDLDHLTTTRTIGIVVLISHCSIRVALAFMGLPTIVLCRLNWRTLEISRTHVVTATIVGGRSIGLTSTIFVAWKTNFKTWNCSFMENSPNIHRTGQMSPNMLLKET
jgi:hypothetical protein